MTPLAFAPNDINARRSGLGGSDAAAALGFSPYKSQYELWLEKTGRVVPEPAGEAALWGNLLEDSVAKEFARRNGVKVRRDNLTHQHPDFPFMFAHLDRRIVGKNWGLEVKTASPFIKGFDEEGTDQIPMQYLAQVHHYIETCDLEGMEIALLKGGQQLKFFTVERNREFGETLCTAEKFFWETYVLADVAPPPTCDRDINLLAVTGEEVQADPQTVEAVNTCKALMAQIKELESVLEVEKTRVKCYLGGRTKLTHNGEVLATMPQYQRKSIDTKALKESRPDLADQFEKVTEYRMLRFK